MVDAAKLVIGMDGGGSGCRAAVSTLDGTVIGRSESGAANFTSDPEGTLASILRAVTELAESIDQPIDTLLAAPAHLGLAGIITPDDASSFAQRLPFKSCRVSDDQLTSVIGALGDRDGALIGVGTGSFIAMKRRDRIDAIGGWGLELGDQGSGAWLGKQALQRCALVADGLADPSLLIATLMQRFKKDAGELIRFARAARPSDYAQFAPVVFDAAKHGDTYATRLVSEGASYFDQCLNSFDLKKDDVVCLVGGLSESYAQRLNSAFQEKLSEPAGSALDGALRLARKLASKG